MKKVLTGVLGVALLLGAGVLYVVQARTGGPAVNARPVVSGRLAVAPGNLYFQNLAEGPDQGKLATVPVNAPDGPRQVGDLHCDRFATARNTSICLRLKPGSLPPITEMLVLGPDLAVRHQETLPGTPSRARVSPDGNIVNWTLFITGDSYSASGFSTRTGLYDLDARQLVKSIEELPVFVGHKRYFASDVNYWGITFAADGKHFYVTLGSKGKTYLIQGDFRSYRGEAIAENVECPSLSPDGKRIAYKQKKPDGTWRLAVLDLATRQVTHPAEDRAVDDQPLWRDNKTLLYALRRDANASDIWSTPITPTGTPTLLIPDASSPASAEPTCRTRLQAGELDRSRDCGYGTCGLGDCEASAWGLEVLVLAQWVQEVVRRRDAIALSTLSLGCRGVALPCGCRGREDELGSAGGARRYGPRRRCG